MGMTTTMTMMMTTMMTSGACSATFAPRLLRTSQTLLALEPWYMPGFVVFWPEGVTVSRVDDLAGGKEYFDMTSWNVQQRTSPIFVQQRTMKMKSRMILLIISIILSTACKKDEGDADPAPTSPTTPSNSQGQFRTTREWFDYGGGTSYSESAFAFFQDAAGANLAVDSVRVGGLRLQTMGPGRYVVTSFNGLDLGTESVVWSVYLAAAGVQFEEDLTSLPYPTIGEMTSGASVSTGNSYTLSVAEVSGADSVIFTLGSLRHSHPGNTVSTTFTAAEISSLAPEEYVGKALALKRRTATLDNMSCQFAKQVSRSRLVLVGP